MHLPASFFRSLQSFLLWASVCSNAGALEPALFVSGAAKASRVFQVPLCQVRQTPVLWAAPWKVRTLDLNSTLLFLPRREPLSILLWVFWSNSSAARLLYVYATGSHLFSETGETEVSPLGSPLKSRKIRYSPEWSQELGFFFHSLHWARGRRYGERVLQTIPFVLSGPPTHAISCQHLE